MSEFTKAMKSAIGKSGYKDKYVAEKMGIRPRKLSDILNERKVIDEKIILSFCNALNIEPNELFGYDKRV